MRIVAIDVDDPAQHAAMVLKLDLPFPYLSDPDRSMAIEPFGVANPDDARELAYPAMVLVDRDGEERWRWVSRDYADRIDEDEVIERVEALGAAPVAAEALVVGEPEPGPKAMPVRALVPYFRGAKFAAMAMYMRLRDTPAKEQAKAESKAFAAEMDRYIEQVQALLRRLGDD